MSAHAPINYRLPFAFENRNDHDPPADSFNEFQHYVDLRMCAYGSNHPGGANFCMGDGVSGFLIPDTNQSVLRA